MSKYVDGYVLPVSTDKLDEYREMAAEAGKVWMKHGALEYVESVGDDLSPTVGDVELKKFSDLVPTGPDETVIFAFITYHSREHRDTVNAAVMEELGEDDDTELEMPFDVSRMAYGGFTSIVNYSTADSDEQSIGTTR